MNKKQTVTIGAVVLLIIAGFATSGFGLLAEDRNGPLQVYGNVDIREVDMAFRLPGRISEIAVDEGDKVQKGDTLAILDPAPLESRIAEADAAIATAEAQLAQLRNGSRPQDIGQGRAKVAAAQAAYDKAQEDVDRREELVAPGAISRDVWQSTVTRRDQAKAQLDEAKQLLSKLEAGARSEEIEAARAQLRQTRAARGSLLVDLGDTRLTAASEGTVTTRAHEPGAMVGAGQTVLTISIDRPLRVRAYVAESDLSRVAPGMAVEVSADGNDTVYKGTIGYISPQAEFTPKTVQTEDLRTDLVYRMRITVSDPDDGLRQGQPVTVRIPPRQEKD